MSKMIIRIVTSAALLLVLLTLAPRTWAQISAGSISALSGTVTVERAGKSIPAVQGTALRVGDKLTTGPNSRVSVSLSDGSQLELDDSSGQLRESSQLRGSYSQRPRCGPRHHV